MRAQRRLQLRLTLLIALDMGAKVRGDNYDGRLSGNYDGR
jgi:hypothetical protein